MADLSSIQNGRTSGEAFQVVQDAEIEALRARRRWSNTRESGRPAGAGIADVERVGKPADDFCTWNTVGLALSGGGVRSATFALGVLQAFDAHKLIGQLDYLSTVSGGGYIGAALTSTLQQTRGTFVFGGVNLYRDTDAVGHLRNYSNYLMPRSHSSARNAAEAAAVVLRGLLTNVFIVSGVLLLLAWLTVLAYPTVASLREGSFLLRLVGLRSVLTVPFALTLILLAAFAASEIAWALYRSLWGLMGTDVRGSFLCANTTLIYIILGVGFLDLQPLLIDWLRDPHSILARWAGLRAAFALVPAALVSFFAGRIADFLKATEATPGSSAVLKRVLAKAALWASAILFPLVLELSYLEASWWLMDGTPRLRGFGLIAALAILIISWFFEPNANSLHRFYRDRLSRAFLFQQVSTDSRNRVFWSKPNARTSTPASSSRLAPRDHIDLSELDTPETPYHLLNTTLNLQASRHSNKRGRDSDFFLFTPKHFGGSILGYYPVAQSGVDLATAVAISGAAASSEMGSNTSLKILAPTLAFLNIRLGYWLDNPRKTPTTFKRWFRKQMYLASEMLGWLDEDSTSIYLTDGGHIENLGIYELLRRGCKLIIAVDAEADPNMTCGALVKAERYARIDLGVRLDAPFQAIARANAAVSTAMKTGADAPRKPGPHVSLGRIHYPNGVEGVLLHIKASVSGDEPDYVLTYKSENPSFPHETTSDQFFSEEQFEAYRALGFHIADRLFSREDLYESPGDDGEKDGIWNDMWSAMMHRH